MDLALMPSGLTREYMGGGWKVAYREAIAYRESYCGKRKWRQLGREERERRERTRGRATKGKVNRESCEKGEGKEKRILPKIRAWLTNNKLSLNRWRTVSQTSYLVLDHDFSVTQKS